MLGLRARSKTSSTRRGLRAPVARAAAEGAGNAMAGEVEADEGGGEEGDGGVVEGKQVAR